MVLASAWLWGGSTNLGLLVRSVDNRTSTSATHVHVLPRPWRPKSPKRHASYRVPRGLPTSRTFHVPRVPHVPLVCIIALVTSRRTASCPGRTPGLILRPLVPQARRPTDNIRQYT